MTLVKKQKYLFTYLATLQRGKGETVYDRTRHKVSTEERVYNISHINLDSGQGGISTKGDLCKDLFREELHDAILGVGSGGNDMTLMILQTNPEIIHETREAQHHTKCTSRSTKL